MLFRAVFHSNRKVYQCSVNPIPSIMQFGAHIAKNFICQTLILQIQMTTTSSQFRDAAQPLYGT